MGILYSRTLGHPFPHIKMHKPDMPTDRLTVWLNGVKEVGTRPGPQIEKYLLDKGDLLKVTYSRGEFNGTGAARMLADFCEPYESVTLIGASGGGLLAYDTIKLLTASQIRRRAILVDAPFEGSDINGEAAKKLADKVPSRLALPAFINKRLIGRSSLSPEPGLTNEELALIDEHHRRVARLPIGSLASRLRFIYRHPKPLPRHLSGVPVVIVNSKDDPVVNRTARHKWTAVCDTVVVVEADATGHVAMLEQAGAWHAVINRAFDALDTH